MKILKPSDSEFKQVAKGLALAAEDLPNGKVAGDRIVSKAGDVYLLSSKEVPENGFVIEKEKGGYGIAASNALGHISGILNLAKAIKEGKKPEIEVFPHFKSRFYKHEANLGGGTRGHRWVGELSEDFWIEYAKALVRNNFTGLVFYSGYHGFEAFLDYKEFPEAPSYSKEHRAKTLAGLKRAWGAARSMGLSTFLQHYVTHFTEGLVKKHKLPIQECEAEHTRLAAFHHPVVDKYSRYIYRRTFELLPELSGFYLNFESSSNSGESPGSRGCCLSSNICFASSASSSLT